MYIQYIIIIILCIYIYECVECVYMHIRNPDFGHALITPLSNRVAPNGPGKIVMAQWRSYSQLCGFLRFLQAC